MSIIRSRRGRRREKGQAFVEYVILIAVVALASIFVLAQFSDRLRDIVAGITNTLGGDAKGSDSKKSLEVIKELDAGGVDDIN